MIKLLDKVITIDQKGGERRCVLTKDKYNWILITAPPDATDEYISENGDRYFYKDIEAFLTSLLLKRFRALVRHWDEDRVINAVNTAKDEVVSLAHELEENMEGLLIWNETIN